MNENRARGRWSWPLAFFLLNFAAIIAWFGLQYSLTVRELSVIAMSPSGVETAPDAVGEIRLDFNLPLNPETVGPDSIRLVPAVAGAAEAAGPAGMRFVPREPLRAATAYTVIVSPAIRGKRGEAPPKELLEFSTTRFKLLSYNQVTFDRNSFTVELEFNQPIAASDLQKALAVKSSSHGDEVEAASRVKVQGSASARRQRLIIAITTPGFLLVTLPAGLAGSSGPLGLAGEERILWRIVGGDVSRPGPEWTKDLAAAELRPEVTFLGMTAEWDDGSGMVSVRTTASPELEKAKKYINIEPEMPFTLATSWNGFKIVGDFRPGKQYRVILAAGLPFGDVGNLEKEVRRQVWFDDLPSKLAFTHGGGFLSPEGLLKVPVTTRNVDEFKAGARRLYASNIVEALLRDYDGDFDADYTEPETVRGYRPGGPRNRDHETLLDLRELLGEAPVGVYGLEIWYPERRWAGRNALVAVSDLGLAAREGARNMMVWTTSIREGAPRQGVKVAVYSNKRQLLAEGVSNAEGVANVALPDLPDGESPALVLGEAAGGEFSFIRLDSDRRSRPSPAQADAFAGGYEVFLTADRGVYRGGEKVLLAGLVRDAEVSTVPGIPLELRLNGPDGKRLRKETAKTDAAGRLFLEMPLGASWAGGLYTVEAYLPGQKERLGSALFRVADYLPETLSVAMEFREKKPAAPEPGPDNQVLIRVSRLAGGELEGIPVTVLASYSPAPFAPKGWEDWSFGDARLKRSGADRRERNLVLGPGGAASAEWDDPELEFPAAARMTVRAEAAENGGRVSAAVASRLVHTVPFYTGAHAEKRGAEAGQPYALDLAAVAPDGGVFDLDGVWSAKLVRIEHDGVMRRDSSGRLRYEWVRREIPEADLAGEWRDGRSSVSVTPPIGGQYRLLLDTTEGRGLAYDFMSRGPGGRWYGEDPEQLSVNLDRDSYRVGDSAAATVSAPFAGKALITVETDEVLAHWIRDFHEGDNTFTIPVGVRMRPNAYVGVTLLRPALAEAEWQPHRLSGLALLKVDNRDRRLALELDAPESLQPGKTADIAVKVTHGGEAVAGAPVALWAVDMGILSLTGYKTPSPWEWFYRVRRAGVREADMFSRLAPELSAWLAGEASPGGDGFSGDGELARRLNPVMADRVKAAVLADLRLVTGEDGVCRAALPVPEFAGRLKFMCWAASGNVMGAAEREVEVKAPVSVSAAWPRFAAPGDSFDVVLTVLNRSGASGRVRLDCGADSGLGLEPHTMEIDLADNQAKQVTVKATALEAGVAHAVVTATLGEETFSDRVELSVRPPVLFARESGSVTLKPGENQALILGPGLMAENSRVKVLAGGSPMVNLAGSLDSLLDYPYGCAEQTASRLLALTALPDLLNLSRPGQLESGEIGALATACVERLRMMQNGNGSLRMWPSGGEELFWVSAQALFTLMETRAASHEVPQSLIDNLCEYLDTRLDSRLEEENLRSDDGESAAMACLGMAKAGRLKRAWLLRLEEIAVERAKRSQPFSSAALAHMVEAMAVAGDRESGERLFTRFQPSGAEAGKSAGDGRVAELAAWLMASMAVGADADVQAGFAQELADMLRNGFTSWSTKENSLVLAALGRYWRKLGPVPDADAFATIAGAKKKFSTRRGGAWEKLSAGTRVEFDNPGAGSLRVFWLAEGVPLTGKAKEEDRGIVARRRVYDRKGTEIAAPYVLDRGEVYEIRLSVTGRADDLVLADLLPAGLEIEDASLKGRPLDGAAAKGLSVKNVERKDDRLLVFASVKEAGEYRYLVRAVTGGAFVWPALDAGRMYDAATRSVNGRNELKIRGGKEAANDS